MGVGWGEKALEFAGRVHVAGVQSLLGTRAEGTWLVLLVLLVRAAVHEWRAEFGKRHNFRGSELIDFNEWQSGY